VLHVDGVYKADRWQDVVRVGLLQPRVEHYVLLRLVALTSPTYREL
jgi:hypothetical protein